MPPKPITRERLAELRNGENLDLLSDPDLPRQLLTHIDALEQALKFSITGLKFYADQDNIPGGSEITEWSGINHAPLGSKALQVLAAIPDEFKEVRDVATD